MRVEVDGQRFDVPDDATPEEIDALTRPAAPAARTPTIGERLKYATHKTAGLLPAAGGIAGAAIGAPLGGVLGLPAAGVGGLATGAAGAALGAGLLSAAGRSVQRSIDTALGYEQDPGILEATKDAAQTGARDAAATAAGGLIAPTLLAAAKRATPALDELGNRFARRLLSGGATPLTTSKPVSAAAIDEAIASGAIKPFRTTAGTAKALDAARDSAGQELGDVIQRLEAAGVQGPDAAQMAQDFMAKAATARGTSLNPSVAGAFDSAGKQLQEMPEAAPTTASNGRLPLSIAEQLKRSLQDMARSSYKRLEPTAVGEAHEEAASALRSAVEQEIEQQAHLAPDAAANFIPAKQRFGRLSEASTAATKGAAQAERRQAFSLTDVLLAAAAHGHGGPLEGAGAAVGSKLLRTYGPSTAATALKRTANWIDALPSGIGGPAGAEVGAVVGDEQSPVRPPLTADRILQLLLQRNAQPSQ